MLVPMESPTRPSLRPLFALLLVAALAIPLSAQQTPPAPSQSATPSTEIKEGFWGRVNPFARKKWVNKRVDPLRDRLNELDEVNAANAGAIKDVDARAQAGIAKAQTAADLASEQAKNAGKDAERANGTAVAATRHADQIGQTIGGLDQFKSVRELDVYFQGATAKLTADSEKQLAEFAAGLKGRQGFLVEIEGHARGKGELALQSSARLNEAVKRFLVGNAEVPVYRLHTVALGQTSSDAPKLPVKGQKPLPSSVHLRVMENSLAAR